MRARALGLVAALSLLLSGCASLPVDGSVGSRPGQEPVDQVAGAYDYTPAGPRPGSTPLQIVEDFLLAMQASPQSTAVARSYLTEQARARWFPDRSTIIYGSRLVTGRDRTFTVALQQADRLDDRGSWLGEVGGADGVSYDLRVVRERGQWRIADPPDALVVPRSYFDARYQQYFVYFFAPTGQVLVPEPTYLPRGEQAPTLLVRRLLRGPHPGLRGVLRTFIPGGTQYVLSIPVSPQGVADVDLSRQLLRLDDHDRQMALAQLAWTLRQIPGLASMRVTAGGVPLDLSGAAGPQRVTSWGQYDPAVQWASEELFGIRYGHVVAVDPDSDQVVGRFGAQGYPLRDIAVDIAGERMAGVTQDGTTVVVSPRGQERGAPVEESPPAPDPTRVVYDRGVDLLKPAWDVFGDVWLVDRRPDGASVSLVRDGVTRRVPAPGLDGRAVKAFLVSRDGSRLVAVVSGPRGDHLAMARVLRGPDGSVHGLTPAREVPMTQGSGSSIRDIAWWGPAGLAVLTGPTPGTSQVLMVMVDGSTPPPDAEPADLFRHRAVHLVSSPSSGTSVLLQTSRGGLYQLDADGQWGPAPVRLPLQAATFVG